MHSFSERQGLLPPGAEIQIRDDAPDDLRHALPVICGKVGLTPRPLRALICEVLLKAPDKGNWSEYPNIEGEVQELLSSCPWFNVYDVIEAVFEHLNNASSYAEVTPAAAFENQINRLFRQQGIGWQLVEGRIEMRGSQAFEVAVRHGRDELWQTGKKTAATELQEAIVDLSKRPEADVTGAIQHGLAALECVARDKCGSGDTLGAIVARNPGLFPRPIDDVVRQAYGWASNNGRHLLEGTQPSFEEAELMVGLSGVLCRYVSRKI